jgi:alpha-tubulin suppressor-like RCC1 family protein
MAAGGYHTLAMDEAGRVWAWGRNSSYQLGDGTDEDKALPVPVDLTALNGAEVVAIAAGFEHSLALDEMGRLWQWGRNYSVYSADMYYITPHMVDLSALAGVEVVSVASGRLHSLAVDATGRLWAWGRNASGQLGDGTVYDRTEPVPVDDSPLGGISWMH